MKKLNSRLDSITKPFIEVGPWLLRLTLGISMFIHGYKKLPAPAPPDNTGDLIEVRCS